MAYMHLCIENVEQENAKHLVLLVLFKRLVTQFIVIPNH